MEIIPPGGDSIAIGLRERPRYLAAARLIAEADGLIICAGAGMGVDSGLPDFRGPGGFWAAYPALGDSKVRFEEVSSPAMFRKDPFLAWGFYGHRLQLYRATEPHDGFRILKELAASKPHGAFVFTSNVDGQFQKAGFQESRIVECHGSIHYLQCLERCADTIWNADAFTPAIDESRCRITSEMPRCPRCQALARPAILMFDDWEWIDVRWRRQSTQFSEWRQHVAAPVVIEIGAGSAIPTVRRFSDQQDCAIIRMNPREWEVSDARDIGIPVGALAGVRGIRDALHDSVSGAG
jgi:NAD-dependent SIR2 family protein deacetylase